MIATHPDRAKRSPRQQRTLAATLGAASVMFFIAGLLLAFVLYDSHASFVVSWKMIFAGSIAFLLATSAISGYFSARYWKQVKQS